MRRIARILKLNLGARQSVAKVEEATAVSKSTVHYILLWTRMVGVGSLLHKGRSSTTMFASM